MNMRSKKEVNVEIGGQVKRARDAANITQEQLAERIDVSPQYVSDLERGVVGVSIPTLKRLCSALGVSSDTILFGAKTADTAEMLAHKLRAISPDKMPFLLDIIDAFVGAVGE